MRYVSHLLKLFFFFQFPSVYKLLSSCFFPMWLVQAYMHSVLAECQSLAMFSGGGGGIRVLVDIYPCTRLSDVFKDYSVYLCRECDYSCSYSAMGRHVRTKHKLTNAAYLAKHDKHAFKVRLPDGDFK